MTFNLLVEGAVDEGVAGRILAHCGHTAGVCYGKQGIGYIRKKADAFSRLAFSTAPMFVLVDYGDLHVPCAACIRNAVLSVPGPHVVVRAAVPEVESWLLADSHGLAGWLGISAARIPQNPESVPDPKRMLVQLAAKSRKRGIKAAMVPAGYPNASAQTGPEYTLAVSEFIHTVWEPEAAAGRSESLRRCLARLIMP